MLKKSQKQPKPPAYRPNKYSSSFRIADGIGSFLANLPKYGFLGVVAWQARISVESLAGKTTFASFFAHFSKGETESNVMTWVCRGCMASAILGIGYGLYMRWLLRRQIEKDTVHRQKLERIIDSKKSSSYLTSKGDTNPADQ